MAQFLFHFSSTVAGQIANEVSVGFHGRPIESLDQSDRILLIHQAARIGREELVDVLISLMPIELRMAASDAYDRVTKAH